MTTLGERVRAARKAKGWTQAELASRVTLAGFPMSQGGIAQIENRPRTRPQSIVQLADALEVSIRWLQSNLGQPTDELFSTVPTGSELHLRINELDPARPAKTLQVFASVRDESEGTLILSDAPVAWIARPNITGGLRDAYGCFVSGDSMEPAYQRGNLLLIDPTATPRAGEDCLFLHDAQDGARRAQIGRLVERTADGWTIEQFNPPSTFTLKRSDWRQAHLVAGKYNRWG